MKKIAAFLLLVVFLTACKSTSVPNAINPPSTKLDRSSQVAIKGDWKVTEVSYTGSNYFKMESFGIADSQCFVGSTWNFISNNNKGSFSLTKENCPTVSSPIVWSINDEGMFVLKIIGEGLKSKAVTQGYILKVANQTETSFQLLDKISIGGKVADVTYKFEKINK